MKFRNLTPFAAQCFATVDVQDREYSVLVMKVGYALDVRPDSSHATLRVLDADPVSLNLTDTHWGVPGHSSVRLESDLAPFKPKCDVLLLGSAHAPGGQPAAAWSVRVHLSDTPKHARTQEPVSVLDKTLVVRAPGTFREGVLGWSVQAGPAVSQVPLRWENTFGGLSQVPNPKHRKDPEQPEWLLNEACYTNPLGRGWVEKRFFRLAEQARHPYSTVLPAPCIHYPDEQLVQPSFVSSPQADLQAPQMAKLAQAYKHRPAGFGVVGRAWTPRLQKAGTYDDAWLKERWPRLSKDLDFAYWNGAPQDQQIPWPTPNLRLELWNLLDPSLCPSGYLQATLPGHRAFFLAWFEGDVPYPLQPVIDTLIIDTDARQVSVVWRCVVPKALPIERLEARFETRPEAPLLKWPGTATSTAKEA